MPRAQHVLGSAVLAALLACGGGSDEETLDERVRNVSIAGTVVSDAAFYGDGTIEVRVIPRDVQGKALLVDGMTMAASITSPGGATARVVSSQCIQVRERHPLVLGVVVDASSSMAQNDPDDTTGAAPGRRAAVLQVLDTLTPGDVAMVTDFSGTAATPLRDLACVATSTTTPPPPCLATSASLTADLPVLRQATTALRNLEGTPLYDACLQMTELLAPFTDRKAMVVLSDGLPNDAVARTACLDRSRSANVSLFTIGFGGDAAGITALRELAEATGGSYAPASDPGQLGRVMNNMAYSDGYCRVVLQLTGLSDVTAATPITGEVTVGASGARASFEFLAPPRS